MATNHSPKENIRYQQSLRTSVEAIGGNSPTPETKAKAVTRQVMQSATPSDVRRRIEHAKDAYETTLKKKPLAEMNSQEKYSYALAERTKNYPAQQVALQDKNTLADLDKKIGIDLIQKHGVTEQGLAYVLEKQSPAALKHEQGTKDYAVNMAKICDREAQTPHEKLSKEEQLRQQQVMQLYKDRER
jgi:hypothetical protein